MKYINKIRLTIIFLGVFADIINNPLIAQHDTTLILHDALQYLIKNYPVLKAKQAEFNAAQVNISIIKNSLVPSLDISYQTNYSTYNNITGLFFPQGILPISGPPSATNNYTPTFGSAASIYMNWQPITFGQRTARIKLADADASNKNYNLQYEIFRQQLNLVSDYLDVLLTNEVVKVYEENSEKANYNLSLSKQLTSAGLRPGVDTTLFAAEKSKSEIDLMNVQKQLSVQEIILSQQLGTDHIKIAIDSVYFHRLPKLIANTLRKTGHPLYNYLQSQVEIQQASERSIKLDVLPKLNVWGIAYGRGSGAGTNQSTNGFSLSRFNFGAGLQITMPILHFTDVNLKCKQQQFITQSFEEKLNQVDLDLKKQQQISDTIYANSVRIIDKSEIQLSASQYAYDAMKARYEAGLANYVDFIQVQYNLVKSQMDLKKAYWDVWKALLNQAATMGDLNIFLKN